MAPLWSWRWTSLRILSQHTQKTYGLSSFLGRLYIWKEGTGAGLKCLKSDATPHRRDDYRVERSCSSNLSIVSQSVSQRCRCDFSVDAFHTRYTQSRTKHTKREITITTSVNIRESRPAPMTFFFFFFPFDIMRWEPFSNHFSSSCSFDGANIQSYSFIFLDWPTILKLLKTIIHCFQYTWAIKKKEKKRKENLSIFCFSHSIFVCDDVAKIFGRVAQLIPRHILTRRDYPCGMV